MERCRVVAAFAFVVFILGYVLSQPNLLISQETQKGAPFYSQFKLTLDKYHNEQFEDALKLAKSIRENYPDEPAGVFGLLTTYQTIMRNYRIRLYEAQFDSLLTLSVKLSKQAIKRNKKDGRNYFYLGCAYGSRSIFYAQRGKWLEAFKYGSQVMRNFKRAIAYSPHFYDAYYGIGLYKYWLGAKSKLLRFLPFANDNRQEGLEQIKLAISKAEFLNVDAMYGLSAAYFNDGEYDKALELAQQLYKSYPNNPTLLYRLGRIHQAQENWTEAKTYFNKLQNILKNSKFKSISYQVECLFQVAKCEYQLGNFLQTQKLCQDAIILDKYCDFSKELNGPLDNYSDIKKQLHKLNDKVKSLLLATKSY